MNLLDISPQKLCDILRCDPERGLSEEAARQNRREFGKNTPPPSLFTAKSVFKSLFSNVLFCIFLVLCVFSLFTADAQICGVCLLCATACYTLFYLYCHQRSRVLTRTHPRYRLLRGGKQVSLPMEDIVPGDILFLSRGQSVPCDGILLRADGLKVCQIHLDGHAQTAKYDYDEATQAGRPSDAYRLFCASTVAAGRCVLLVCNTGKNIRKSPLSEKGRGKLPRAIAQAGDYARRLSLGLLLVVTVLFFLGLFLGQDAFSTFFLLSAICVAVLPELAEALCKLCMVLPLRRLAQRGCLLQNYACLDHLLTADRVLIDSPAYFLDSDIQIANYFYSNCKSPAREVSEGLYTLLSYSRLCCEGKPKKKEQMWYGKSSIDAAICRTAPAFGVDDKYLDHAFLTISRSPYEELRGYSSALVLQQEKCYQLVRGRPSEVLDRCTHLLQETRSVALSAHAKARLYQAADQMAAAGEVVVALARRFFRSPPEALNPDEAGYLTFVGFLTFYTPMRAESAEAVSACREDGVHIMLCTDNDPDATLGVAKSMEFFGPDEPAGVLTGEKTRRMDELTLAEQMRSHKVFCGLTPMGKRAVILAQKELGHTVLSCVHSLSDAPAQEAADVSVAVKTEKCDAIRENADLLLDEERFELLPELLRTARAIALNSLRVLRFCILTMVALFSTATLSFFFGKNAVLLPPLAALLFGLLFALICAILLTTDREQVCSLRPIEENSFLHSSLPSLSLYALFCGLAVALSTSATYALARLFSLPAQASGAALCTLFFSLGALFFSARKTKKLHVPEFRQNPIVFATVPLCAVLLCLLLLPTGMREHLGVMLPAPAALPLSLLLSCLPFFVGELYKHLLSRLSARGNKIHKERSHTL